WGSVRYAAHTLGNYLNINSGCLYLLRAALPGPLDAEARGYLDAMQRMTELMSFVARHLTNASAANEVPLLREEVVLSRLVGRACDFFRTVAEGKQIQLLGETDTAGTQVVADRVAVATVLDNLVSNALKYSPRGKRIWVRVRTEPGYVVCTVQDE